MRNLIFSNKSFCHGNNEDKKGQPGCVHIRVSLPGYVRKPHREHRRESS